MIVDESLAPSGAGVLYRLEPESPAFALYEDDSRLGFFSVKILCEVMARYARPIEDDMPYQGETLALDAEVSLMAWYYKSPVDLENKLYLVLLRKGQEPIAVLARQVVSALRFLSQSATP
jgi:hypothetical protein